MLPSRTRYATETYDDYSSTDSTGDGWYTVTWMQAFRDYNCRVYSTSATYQDHDNVDFRKLDVTAMLEYLAVIFGLLVVYLRSSYPRIYRFVGGFARSPPLAINTKP